MIKQCSHADCDRLARVKGLCDAHYQRAKRGAPMDEPLKRKRPNGSQPLSCVIDGCGRRAVANDLCPMHYQRQRTGQDVTAPQKKASPGQGRCLQADGYVVITVPIGTPGSYGIRLRRGRKSQNYGEILEHRFVMQRHLGRALLSSEQVHHKDGNRQNNQIDNLELKTGPHGKGIKASDGIAASINYLLQYASLNEQQRAALASLAE